MAVTKKIKSKKMKPSIAINPKTQVKEIKKYLKYLNHVLVMTVHPGFGGQSFCEAELKKVKQLRKLKPSLNIEVDGGIKIGSARKAKRAGANYLVSGSGIFNYDDAKKAISRLKND